MKCSSINDNLKLRMDTRAERSKSGLKAHDHLFWRTTVQYTHNNQPLDTICLHRIVCLVYKKSNRLLVVLIHLNIVTLIVRPYTFF